VAPVGPSFGDASVSAAVAPLGAANGFGAAAGPFAAGAVDVAGDVELALGVHGAGLPAGRGAAASSGMRNGNSAFCAAGFAGAGAFVLPMGAADVDGAAGEPMCEGTAGVGAVIAGERGGGKAAGVVVASAGFSTGSGLGVVIGSGFCTEGEGA